MRIRVNPGGRLEGDVTVPGDKSIAHRWLLLAATANGSSRLAGLPLSLDIGSTARCLAALFVKARPALDVWSHNVPSDVEAGGSTWNGTSSHEALATLEVEGEGRSSLAPPRRDLDCGNSGTTMRLLAGLLAPAPFTSRLVGDASLSARPMERVAEPLRMMGAAVETSNGSPPIQVEGGPLRGIHYEIPVASAQVKSAILLAGTAASGETTVAERVSTRDHTERLLRALGAPIRMEERMVTVSAFAHAGLDGRVPGDVSSAAFLVVAAAIVGGDVSIRGVGLNPTRLHYLDILQRMGVATDVTIEGDELGEPVGTLRTRPVAEIHPVEVSESELPLIIDEVPVLAILASAAKGPSRFQGAGELRLKESDRLGTVTAGIAALGGRAGEEGNDLVIEGGGLQGGVADPAGDHRIAMALAVGALGGTRPSEIVGMEAASVSFPGFVSTLRNLGADLSVIA